MFSEWIKGNGTAQGNLNMVYLSSTPFSATTPSPTLKGNPPSIQSTIQFYAATCTTKTVTAYTQKGAFWAYHGVGSGGAYAHLIPPNQTSCLFSGESGNTPGYTEHTMIGPQSFHPGGVNVGFLDGSVKFIKTTTNPQTWGAIATIAGGEVIDASSF
jgi:prepilin-type processing-associated H-X9-DG protein